MKNKQFLIFFYYDAYCQGYEEAYQYALVTATSFEAACNKIALKFYKAREFVDLTIS